MGKKISTNEDFLLRVKENNVNFEKFEILEEYKDYKTDLKCKCLICGNFFYKTPRELIAYKNTGCKICGSSKVNDINSIEKNRPDLLKYFKNSNDYKLNTLNSPKNVVLICPICKRENTKNLRYFVKHGFRCDYCNDGLSYPNKFIRFFMEQVKVDFLDFEYSPVWLDKPKYRYDCYFEKNNKSYIIEMDGLLGHGERKFGSNEKDTEGLERDEYKELKAKENNVTIIRINCSISDKDFIKNSILNSELNTIFNIDEIDFEKCDLLSRSNLLKSVCDSYDEIKEISLLSKMYKLERTTIVKYLKIGATLNLCNYNPIESKTYGNKKSTITNKNKAYKILVRDKKNNFVGIFTMDCLINKIKEKNITKSSNHNINESIRRVCRNERNSYLGCKFEYYKED